MMNTSVAAPKGEPARVVRVLRETRDDGVAVVTIQGGHALADEVFSALDAALSDERARAVVVRSSLTAAAEALVQIQVLASLRFADDATRFATRASRRLLALARAKKPVVALACGPLSGASYALALACAGIVLTDQDDASVALPDVRLGVVPAGNALLRVARRAGLAVALDMALTGRAISAERARTLGLVDHVVASSIAIEAACRTALGLVGKPRGLGDRAVPRVQRWLLDGTGVGRTIALRRARVASSARTRGHYPAPDAVLDVLERWAARGWNAAADLEVKRFGELVVSESSHRLAELAAAVTTSRASAPATRTPPPRVAVVGAGLIGAGIAAVSAERGVVVRLKEREEVALGRGLRYVREHLDGRRARSHLSEREHARALGRVTSTTEYNGLRACDVVIEAVFEDLALKREVLRNVEERVRDEAVIASSTASIPVARIAEEARRPERVLGMHFFAPVTRVPLVEVVRGPRTSDAALTTAVALARDLGKTVIVVADGVGFYTTRTLVPFLHEAVRLVAEGVPVDEVDEALVAWGFPLGPLHLADELGIDLIGNVGNLLREAFGERLRAPDAIEALRLDDRMGRKNGRGFYFYGRGLRAERKVDDTTYRALGVAAPRPRGGPKREEIQARCALALVNEALRCLDEGVLASARDGDLGAVLGLGFPAFRGGPFRYVDVLGAAEVLRRTRALEQHHGARFTPAPALVEAARRGRRFWGT